MRGDSTIETTAGEYNSAERQAANVIDLPLGAVEKKQLHIPYKKYVPDGVMDTIVIVRRSTDYLQGLSVPAEPGGRKIPHPLGFTLIELLVVISIIALLAGLILPSLSKARALGKTTACKGNLRSAGTAFRMYLDGSNDIMPNAAAGASSNEENAADEEDKPLLVDVLGPNLSAPEVLLCPDDKDKFYFITEGSSYVYNISLYNVGKPYTENHFVQMAGVENVNVLNEFDEHAHEGAGGKNILYADLHVEE